MGYVPMTQQHPQTPINVVQLQTEVQGMSPKYS